MNAKNKWILSVTLVSMGLILCIFLMTNIEAKSIEKTPRYYMTLANMHLISYDKDCATPNSIYKPIGIILSTQDGTKYQIVTSAFGKSCLVKI